jgi:DNA-binding NarL/FixJ family response regulator
MPRIVVVEDDDRVRTDLCHTLRDLGFEVLAQGVDGRQAVVLASQLRPDVMLLDLRMPTMGGIEAARSIAELGLPIKVVILSAYDDPALSTAAREVGVYAYLVKGCSATLIRDVLMAAWTFDGQG